MNKKLLEALIDTKEKFVRVSDCVKRNEFGDAFYIFQGKCELCNYVGGSKKDCLKCPYVMAGHRNCFNSNSLHSNLFYSLDDLVCLFKICGYSEEVENLKGSVLRKIRKIVRILDKIIDEAS